MSADHLVRIGLLGHVGRFRAVDRRAYGRGQRVLCRTRRGLEIGQVLRALELAPQKRHPESAATDFNASDGQLLRPLTPEDELLVARQLRDRDAAFAHCVALLSQRGVPATLVDVEHLFDGQGLYFYFLGEVTPGVEAVTQELAEAYEKKVQFRKFTDLVERGCGPDCGTESSSGCGTGCAGCAVATACASGPRLDADAVTG